MGSVTQLPRFQDAMDTIYYTIYLCEKNRVMYGKHSL